VQKLAFAVFKLVRELDFPNQFRAGHQDSAKGGKFQFPHEQDGFSTVPKTCGYLFCVPSQCSP
jgi:hypothetical protein